MKDYNRLKTAIQRKQLSKPTKILLQQGRIGGKILNYGCGFGFDSTVLSQMGFDVASYDKYNCDFDCKSVLNKQYDMVMCHYVFNVIPNLEEHEEVLTTLKSLAKTLYITVRCDKKAIQPTWNFEPLSQGYWTPKGTFQRFYNETMCHFLFGDATIVYKDSSLIMVKISS